MREGRASRTAQHNALFRALEAALPPIGGSSTTRSPATSSRARWPPWPGRRGCPHRDILANPERFAGSDRLNASLARVGEQLRFGIEPSELGGFLAERGLVLESDVGAADYQEQYFAAAAREMHGHEFYRVAQAWVAA